jgi:dynein heavy chain
MVYVDPKNLGYRPFWEKWIEGWGDNVPLKDNLNALFDEIFPKLVDRIFEGMDHEDYFKPLLTVPSQKNPVNLVSQICALFDSLLPKEDPPTEYQILEELFLFCSLWSCGACIAEDDFNTFE